MEIERKIRHKSNLNSRKLWIVFPKVWSMPKGALLGPYALQLPSLHTPRKLPPDH